MLHLGDLLLLICGFCYKHSDDKQLLGRFTNALYTASSGLSLFLMQSTCSHLIVSFPDHFLSGNKTLPIGRINHTGILFPLTGLDFHTESPCFQQTNFSRIPPSLNFLFSHVSSIIGTFACSANLNLTDFIK